MSPYPRKEGGEATGLFADVTAIVKKYGFYIKLAISLAFLYLLFRSFLRLDELARVADNFNYYLLGLCLALSLASIFLRAFRWTRVLAMMGGAPAYIELVRLYFIGLYYGSITPGHSGELIRGYYVADGLGFSKVDGFLSVVYERGLDIVATVTYIVIVLAFRLPSWEAILATAAVSIVAYAAGLPAVNYIAMRWMGSVRKVRLSVAGITLSVVVTLLTWLCYASMAAVILLAMHVDVPADPLVFAVFASSLITIVPITVNGWGLREGTYVYLLSGAGPTTAILLSVLLTLMTTYMLGFVGMLMELYAKKGGKVEDAGIELALPGHRVRP